MEMVTLVLPVRARGLLLKVLDREWQDIDRRRQATLDWDEQQDMLTYQQFVTDVMTVIRNADSTNQGDPL